LYQSLRFFDTRQFNPRHCSLFTLILIFAWHPVKCHSELKLLSFTASSSYDASTIEIFGASVLSHLQIIIEFISTSYLLVQALATFLILASLSILKFDEFIFYLRALRFFRFITLVVVMLDEKISSWDKSDGVILTNALSNTSTFVSLIAIQLSSLLSNEGEGIQKKIGRSFFIFREKPLKVQMAFELFVL